MKHTNAMVRKLSVLAVDDNIDYVEAISHLLGTYPCVGTIIRALSGSEAFQVIGSDRPDLVRMDIAMPDINGLDATRVIKARPDPPKVMIVTLYDTPTYREAARAAGADGFLAKSDLGERLQAAIEQLFPQCALRQEAG
jgi:CheY-like chemotaxis protein